MARNKGHVPLVDTADHALPPLRPIEAVRTVTRAMPAAVTELQRAVRALEAARVSLMARGRDIDVPGVLVCRRIERIAGAIATLAQDGYGTELRGLARMLIDALLSAGLLLDTDMSTRQGYVERFARSILEYQRALVARAEKSKIPWLAAMHDQRMADRGAELDKQLVRLGGVPSSKQVVEHWAGNRKEVAAKARVTELYETVYRQWSEDLHVGAASIERSLCFDPGEQTLRIDETHETERLDDDVALCTAIVDAVAKACLDLAAA